MTGERAIRRRLGLAVGLVALLQVTNNLLPYVGWRDDSCQTMFSGLRWESRRNNHLFMPQRMVGDLWVFYLDVDADVRPRAHGRMRDLADWLNRDGIQHNAEAIRVAVRQLCDAGHTVRLSYRPAPGGALVEGVDACATPELSEPRWWLPVRLYDSHYPWPWPPEGEPEG